MSDNILAINIPNIVTVGIMFFAFVFFVHVITRLVRGKPGAEDTADA